MHTVSIHARESWTMVKLKSLHGKNEIKLHVNKVSTQMKV